MFTIVQLKTLTNQNGLVCAGILAQDNSGFKDIIKTGDSYIASSYVKYIEAAGGRVIPIR